MTSTQQTARHALGIIGTVLVCVALIGLALLLGGCQSFKYDEERAKFPKPPFTFNVGKTLSMYPVIKGGELLRCDPVTLPQLHRGMIVVFDSFKNGGWEIHRVQSVNGRRIWVDADNPFTPMGQLVRDSAELIFFEQVIGMWIDERDPRTKPNGVPAITLTEPQPSAK